MLPMNLIYLMSTNLTGPFIIVLFLKKIKKDIFWSNIVEL